MTIKRVVAILLFLELVNLGVRETTDPDMWWHLKTGQHIWAEGIPHHDLFSFTVPDNSWTTHEWLSEVVMWAIYSVSGFAGLILLFAFCSGLAFWLVYRCSAGRPYLAAAVVMLAAFTASPSFGVRCQVLNMLLMATFVHVLERVREGELSRRVLYLLPALTVLWVNLHSGFLLGIAVLLVYAAGAWLEEREGQGRSAKGHEPRAASHDLLLAAIACLLVAVANPAGYHIWIYPFETLGSDLMQKNIIEWGSPDFHQNMYRPFAALLLGGSLLWAFSPRRPNWTELILFIGTGFAGLLSRRHIALFAIVATPGVTRSLTALVETTSFYRLLFDSDDEPIGAAKTMINWTMLVVALLGLIAWDVTKLGNNRKVVALAFPVAAVDYIEHEGLDSARGFNTYPWGGYMIWRGVKVFIDGRADVYGDFMGYYLKTFNLTDDWREPLAKYQVDYILLERESRLATLIAASHEWQEKYTDDVARVFVRAR